MAGDHDPVAQRNENKLEALKTVLGALQDLPHEDAQTVLRTACVWHHSTHVWREAADVWREATAEACADRLRQQAAVSVTELDLTVRALNCLESENIRTIGELCRMTEPDLAGLRNFGRVTIGEIKMKLSERGLRLGMGTA